MFSRTAGSRKPGAQNRAGFALLVAIVFVAIIAIMATVITVNLTGDNDAKRVSKASDILHRFAAEIDSTAPSFSSQVGRKPGRLAHLAVKIVASNASEPALCAVYTSAQAGNWRGPYHLIPIPVTGYQAAPGFVVNNLIERTPPTGTPSRIYLVMDGVAIADARALGIVVDKVNTGVGPIVMFTPSGNNPVRVTYSWPISSC